MTNDPRVLVVGAGPAGVLAIASLAERIEDTQKIHWADPQHAVGDFATLYYKVPGNTKVSAYAGYLQILSKVFENLSDSELLTTYLSTLQVFQELVTQNPDYTCPLQEVAHPIAAASDLLQTMVTPHKTLVEALSFARDDAGKPRWTALLQNGEQLEVDQVVLATGGIPKKATLPLGHSEHLRELSLEQVCTEIDPLLADELRSTGKKVAVIGSSHSAALAVMQLLKVGIEVDWYKREADKPCFYSEKREKLVIGDNTGLKGEVAQYHRDREAGKFATPGLTIRESNELELSENLGNCDYVVHAIGFKARPVTVIKDEESFSSADLEFDSVRCCFPGFPGLMGFGLAHPCLGPEYTLSQEGEVIEKQGPQIGLSKWPKDIGKIIKGSVTGYGGNFSQVNVGASTSGTALSAVSPH